MSYQASRPMLKALWQHTPLQSFTAQLTFFTKRVQFIQAGGLKKAREKEKSRLEEEKQHLKEERRNLARIARLAGDSTS
jgi:hypothetical protein